MTSGDSQQQRAAGRAVSGGGLEGGGWQEGCSLLGTAFRAGKDIRELTNARSALGVGELRDEHETRGGVETRAVRGSGGGWRRVGSRA